MLSWASQWQLHQLPQILLYVTWGWFAWRSKSIWLASATCLGLGAAAWQSSMVFSGGVPTDQVAFQSHLAWSAIAGPMWRVASASRVQSVQSAFFAIGFILSGAWLPALISLAYESTNLSQGTKAAMVAVFITTWFHQTQQLLVQSQLGWLGLSIDATTMLANQLTGAVWVSAWICVLWGLESAASKPTVPTSYRPG